MTVQDLVPKRTRESTSKVRTGCSTCKARRVKCDEAKPICKRCAVGSRKCEYSTAPAAQRRNVITVYLPPTQNQPVLFVNDRGLDFFNQNLAAKLDGQFDATFWSKLVMQLSHSEPSIRHAVSAIGIICRDDELSLRHPAGYVNANPEAQREWNTAAKSLSARIQAHPNSNLVPLVCCLLFTCIEFLRGNDQSSMLHVLNGFNILAALRASPDLASSLPSTELRAIEDHIVPVFSGLNILSTLAGKMTPSMHAPPEKEDTPHQDLSHSRRRLFQLSDTCIRFMNEAAPRAIYFQTDIEDLVEQVKLQTRIDEWRNQLNQMVARKQAAGQPVKQDALNLLLVHCKVIHIWMHVCTVAGESATDSHEADFEELVYCAEQMAKHGGTQQPLSFDVQLLGPLYYAALKCRNPAIRRRALEMLRYAPRREGLWNADHAYATAKRIIELEESHLNEQGMPDEVWRVHGLPLPYERQYDPGEIPFDLQKTGHSIVPSPAIGTLKFVYRTKPWGLLGEYQMNTEYIKL